MNSDVKKIVKNSKHVVLLPNCDLDIKDSVEEMLGNVLIIDDNTDVNEIITCINRSDVKQVIAVNNILLYDKIIPNINTKKSIKWLITKSIASFTDLNINNIYKTMIRFYDRGLVTKIGCIDSSLYQILKKAKYKCCKVSLFTTKKYKLKKRIKNSIGILSNDFDPKHSFYNELTALKLAKIDNVKLISSMSATINFIKDFNINAELCNNIDDVIANNKVNLYINFSNNNNELFFKSMNSGIPCILGNTDLLDSNKFLKNNLTLESDDNVNEMAEKIKYVIANIEKIVKEYDKFKIKYIEKTKKSINELLK